MPPTQPSLGTLIRVGNDFLFSGEWWITIFPGAALVMHGAGDQPARRLAARRAQPEAAMSARWRRRRPRRRDTALPRPLLSVEGLRVEFPTRRGTLVAVDDISFAIAPGEVLGVVGESGAGKSLTGAAIIGLLEPPGRIAAGEIRLDGRRIDNLPPSEMRKVRGREIGAIFQDPLTSLNPLYTIGRQLVETIRTHLPVERARGARARRSRCSRRSASRRRRSASTTIRTSSPAACASAW